MDTENTPAEQPDATDTTAAAPEYIGTATYDPSDNKIRITAYSRLPKELYARVRAAGFIWAPKQEIFVAPMWTPEREDLAIELCGELGDEDKSLVDRAEERAERFDGYSERRAADADSAHKAVSAIADGIPMGQPILVGHHSERRARKDAERIENGMRKAVKMWETSKYWIQRAQGALRHAKYKESPDVRARRIKTLEADRRRQLRNLDSAVAEDLFWNKPDLTHAEALAHAGRSIGEGFTMPRKDGDRPDFNQRPSEYNCLTGAYPNLYAPRTFEEVRAVALKAYPPRIERYTRWIAHYDNRIAYETAMLADQGASHLIAPRPRPTQLPLLNYRIPQVTARRWSKDQVFKQVELTSESYQRINADQRGTLTIDNSHRMRFGFVQIQADGTAARFPRHDLGAWVAVFLTDSKVHPKPTKAAPAPAPEPEAEAEPEIDHVQAVTQGRTIWNSDGTDGPCLICPPPAEPDTVCPDGPACPEPECKAERARRAAPVEDKGAKFAAMKQTLKAGIKVVSAPQLFPTPIELAEKMIQIAEITNSHRILEPSAGTGAILARLPQMQRTGAVAVEINASLAVHLKAEFPSVDVRCADFLQCNSELGTFDRILMNPPFHNGADVLHVRHALNKLKPGGRLVAIVAGGPKQKACLEPLTDLWEELPDGTFAEQGTNVRTVLLVIEKRG